MPFKWIEYLRFSGQLTNNIGHFSCPEACKRTAISRAYYSVFKLAENHMFKTAKSSDIPLGEPPHKRTIIYYKNHNDPKRKKIGVDIDRLKNIREDADYDEEFSTGDVDNALIEGINRATTILSELRKLKNFKE